MMNVFIDGAAGTTGLQIGERLAGRNDLSLITLDDAQRKNDGARRDAINHADIVILCLPDDAARAAVAMIDNPHTRVIDASTAHRIHPDWVFGLPEVTGRDTVVQARFVSNPGCYSTGFIALVAPLVRAGVLPADARLSCNAVSGYSGGGKAMIADYERAEGPPSVWQTYALTLAHKHGPEMQVQSHLAHRPLFAPAVVPLHSGMVVDVPLFADQLCPGHNADTLLAALSGHYAGSPIIQIVEEHDSATLGVELLSGKDVMRLHVFSSSDGAQIRLVAALDNLGKGASGAAVQNLNLMAGLPETTGLRL
jgi:N-acetyl-gamma-glutamyl-phosphate reductase